jgi:hypothetical protein
MSSTLDMFRLVPCRHSHIGGSAQWKARATMSHTSAQGNYDRIHNGPPLGGWACLSRPTTGATSSASVGLVEDYGEIGKPPIVRGYRDTPGIRKWSGRAFVLPSPGKKCADKQHEERQEA